MAINIAINGYGRIGRTLLRALYESGRQDEFKIVAINDLGDRAVNAHLTQYDTTHGRFSGEVRVEGDTLIVNGDKIRMTADRDPLRLPWAELGVDVIQECTGSFTSREKAAVHLASGAKKVLISAPAGNEVKTIVYGVNEGILSASDTIVSNASCTTNCLAPLVKPLHEKLGVVRGLMTTIHAYTNDQVLIDIHRGDIRRARSATHSMIPTKTGAAAAMGLVLPELSGKLDGFAMRVPVINVSVVDLTFTASRETTVEEVNAILREAVAQDPRGVIACNELPLVSIDFNHNPASSIFDLTQTKVIGNMVKVLAWYDNEWAFVNRMLDTTKAMMTAK
jgi:glyceraldehyde 3-phosphate dehydrogenase